ncbi:hypothetical protein [Clostridium sp. DJ247]|uniref:hypothetical protein n=1 Tax=Clostridium sp. DJ247 TaxID=2726188 RepID=UPI0016295506|nr:hypothetical protein [Clostridium sp. DJ247]MBC2579579.1 hypothetical protein [Clostridium sp. DJ247]
MSTNLNIRVISNLTDTQQFLLYQEDIKLNVKNFKIGAWEHQYLAPKATFFATLPTRIAVRAKTSLGKGTVETKEIEVDYNTAWDIFENKNAVDIGPSTGEVSGLDTIDVYNKCPSTKFAIVTKDSKPLFACEVRPNFKVNFSIHPKIFLAISDLEIHGDFFDAATISAKYAVEYEGQDYLTFYLNENTSTGEILISHDFNKFDI